MLERTKPDGRTRFRLEKPDCPALDQLEDGDERDDDLHLDGIVGEQILETHGARRIKSRADELHLLLDRERLASHGVDGFCFQPVEHSRQGREQLEHLNAQRWLQIQIITERIAAAPDVILTPLILLPAQLQGGLLEAFVLQQPSHQLGTRVLLIELLLHLNRQQQARLDAQQCGGHHQEIAGIVQRQKLDDLKILQKLVSDRGDGNVVDVDLVLLDQVQQKIQRPLKSRQLDLVSLAGPEILEFRWQQLDAPAIGRDALGARRVRWSGRPLAGSLGAERRLEIFTRSYQGMLLLSPDSSLGVRTPWSDAQLLGRARIRRRSAPLAYPDAPRSPPFARAGAQSNH